MALTEIHAIEHQRVVFVVDRRRQRELLEIIIVVVIVIVVGIVITSFIVVNVINIITIDITSSRTSTSVSNSSDGKVTCIIVDDSIFALIGGRHFTER